MSRTSGGLQHEIAQDLAQHRGDDLELAADVLGVGLAVRGASPRPGT